MNNEEIVFRLPRWMKVPLPNGENYTRVKNLIHENKLNLKHCVLTSVARDDLNDGGARFWASTIKMVIDAGPEVISHNLETVKRLSPVIRNNAYYERSLEVIRMVGESGLVSKSGIMLGLGET